QRPMRVLLGASSAAGARRAARVADGFEPAVEGDLVAVYEAERVRLGRESVTLPAQPTSSRGVRFLHVADDPDAAWAKIAPHAMLEMNSYAKLAEEAGRTNSPYHGWRDADQMREAGVYRVMTPQECI